MPLVLEKNRFVSNWFHRQPQTRLAVFKGGRAGILQRLKWAPTVTVSYTHLTLPTNREV